MDHSWLCLFSLSLADLECPSIVLAVVCACGSYWLRLSSVSLADLERPSTCCGMCLWFFLTMSLQCDLERPSIVLAVVCAIYIRWHWHSNCVVFVVYSLARKYNTGNNTLSLIHGDNEDDWWSLRWWWWWWWWWCVDGVDESKNYTIVSLTNHYDDVNDDGGCAVYKSYNSTITFVINASHFIRGELLSDLSHTSTASIMLSKSLLYDRPQTTVDKLQHVRICCFIWQCTVPAWLMSQARRCEIKFTERYRESQLSSFNCDSPLSIVCLGL